METKINRIMKAILTIASGNKDPKNFTRDIELTQEEFDYLRKCERIINQGDNRFMSISLYQL
jgi:hypothetical protein